jgi:hypothetical protein
MHEMDFLLHMLVGSSSHDALPPEWQVRLLVPLHSHETDAVAPHVALRAPEPLPVLAYISICWPVQAYIVPFTRKTKKQQHAS